MSLYKIQGAAEKRKGVYYEFDSEDEPLGVGGMGRVYKGRCVDGRTGSSRDVAVKFMYSDLSPYAIEKARREAAIQFKHNNLIEMLGFIETECRSVLGEPQHHYHVISELLEGVSLSSLFEGKLTDQKGNFVPFAEKIFRDYQQDPNHFAVEITKNILSGLMTMHDAGYIHRDIDPTNIMITTDGNIKLIDFGIAKKMNSLTTGDKHLTRTGQFVGKPEYAAPELVRGLISEQNQTTDIYAVGILLFHCIVGHPPFEGDTIDILEKQQYSPLPLKLIKHKGLRKIIAKATEKSKAKRYQSAAEFRVALEKVQDYAESQVNWKYIGIGSVAVACVIVSIFSVKQGKKVSDEVTYPSALTALHSDTESGKGVEMLRELASKDDADATFLLSQLLFKCNKEAEAEAYSPDSIIEMRGKVNIAMDNKESHELLLKTVELSPRHYQALFELGCNYWKSDQRTDVIENREAAKAEEYFNLALKYAREANDSQYIKQIEYYLGRIKLFNEMKN